MIICCNYFYINVKWPLTRILIGGKAHLLEDKQIPNVGIFDKDLFGTFLRGHLSQNSCLFGQILPQIISFLILGTWDVISGKWSILDVLELKYDKNGKVLENRQNLHLTASAIKRDTVT